jgi:hypothetical protein
LPQLVDHCFLGLEQLCQGVSLGGCRASFSPIASSPRSSIISRSSRSPTFSSRTVDKVAIT